MLIDNIYGSWFINFVIFNKINTPDIADELLLFFRKSREIQISQYFKSHKNIKHNQLYLFFITIRRIIGVLVGKYLSLSKKLTIYKPI